MFAGRGRQLLITDLSIVRGDATSIRLCMPCYHASARHTKEYARTQRIEECTLYLTYIQEAYHEDGMVYMFYDNGARWHMWVDAKYFQPDTVKGRVDSALTKAFNLC